MSAGDIATQGTPTNNYDCDDSSSSSQSLFNRKYISIKSSASKIKNNEHAFKSNSRVRSLEQKVDALQQVILDLSDQVRQLKSANDSPTHSPSLYFRINSIPNSIKNDHFQENVAINSSRLPIYGSRTSETCMSRTNEMKSSNYVNESDDRDQIHHLQELLDKTNAVLERRDNEIDYLKKEIDKLRCAQTTSGEMFQSASLPTSHVTHPSDQLKRTSTFLPITPSSTQPQSITVPKGTINATPIMPFSMSLNNNLPNFGGKENELPTKFINEFELRASGLFGYQDEYLLRAVQQVLSDTALTWFIQQQQEQPITTWSQFKKLFLLRFRTPDKIELLRGRLRILWQGDTEPTVDYFERLKALVSEIEPVNSNEYLKRKFLQKLRKDIREKMPLGLTSILSDLVQKAIEIETNIIQQKIDDRLRAAQNEENLSKRQPATINNLHNVSETNAPDISFINSFDSHNINVDDYNKTPSPFSNKYPRTFTNSIASSFGTSKRTNVSLPARSHVIRNEKVKLKKNNRWCSFCSSTSHNWLYCYHNVNGPNYQPTRLQYIQQEQQHDQQSMPPSDQQYSNQQQHNQSQNQNLLTHQQQNYRQSQPSFYLPSEQHLMTKNVPGSRF